MSTRAIKRKRERQFEGAARRARRLGLAAGGAVGATVLFGPGTAEAATFEVTTLADNEADGCATNECTLREAIADAAAAPGGDDITFASALSGAINLTSELLVNDDDEVTITETGPNYVTATSSTTTHRIFRIDEDTKTTISGLDMYGGYSTSEGGAILVDDGSRLNLSDLTISDSQADDGGAITNDGRVVGSGVTISGNAATNYGGGISNRGGRLILSDSEVSGNDADVGGAISNKYSNATLANVDVVGNDATGMGGGIANFLGNLEIDQSTISGNGLDTPYIGGGIANVKYSSASITGSDISDNAARYAGGGFAHIAGIPGKYGGGADGGLPFTTRTLIKDTTLDGNRVNSPSNDGTGGNVFIGPTSSTDSFVLNGSTVSGGAVTDSGGDLTRKRGVLGPPLSGYGGGIGILGPNYGDFEVRNSTISGNAASTGGGVSVNGGAVRIRRAEDPAAQRKMRRSVREAGADPDAPAPYGANRRGGPSGGDPSNYGEMAFNNSTVADNYAGNAGGGFYSGVKYNEEDEEFNGREVTLSSTIAGDNAIDGGPNDLADFYGRTPDLRGEPTGTPPNFLLEFALVEEPGLASYTQDPAGQSIIGSDPALGALADNGGGTYTHLPAGSSPVVDQGIDNRLGRDQRDELRRVNKAAPNNPAGDPTDIGSVELQGETEGEIRPLRASEVPADCPVAFGAATLALAGDNSGQTINGGPGKDILRGKGGKDTLIGRGSADCLSGDKDGDKLNGRNGDDWMDGGAGADFIKGQLGDDTADGGGGSDRIKLSVGDDTADGGGGDDNIAVGEGDDTAKGGNGNDRIFGNTGDDDLRGGRGNDVIFGGGGSNDIDCGPGKDRVVVLRKAINRIAADCERVVFRKS